MRYVTVIGAAIMLGCLAFSSQACKKYAGYPATRPAPVTMPAAMLNTISVVYGADGSCLVDGRNTRTEDMEGALRDAIAGSRAAGSGPASRPKPLDPIAEIVRFSSRAEVCSVAFSFDDPARVTYDRFEPALAACARLGVIKLVIADIPLELPRGRTGVDSASERETTEPATIPEDQMGSVSSVNDLPKLRQALNRPGPAGALLTCTPKVTMALVFEAMKAIRQAKGLTLFCPHTSNIADDVRIDWRVTTLTVDNGGIILPGGAMGQQANDGWIPFGPSKGGNGQGPKSAFFGVGGNAHHVVFCVDATGSMAMPGKNGVAFDVVREQMLRSISRLAPVQDFHVVIFKEGPVLELPGKRLLPVTPENRTAAAHWLGEVIPYGAGDDPVPALNRCFDVLEQADKDRKGKQIFLLTDGAFPNNDAVLRCIRERNKAKDVHVYTFLYGEQDDPSAVKLMKDIAAETGGKYKNITE